MSSDTLPLLKGRNITLRKARPEDADARLALGSDPHIHEMFGGSRETLAPITTPDAAAWVRHLAEHPFAWVIEHRVPIGEIRLDRLDKQDRRASLAIGIFDPTSLGKGLGTEAIRLILDFAFRTLKLHRISIRVLAYNTRAIRAYQKCGFVIEGREREAGLVNGQWHDDIIMGLLEHEFVAT